MFRNPNLFILGAADPEMNLIEKLLADCGATVAHAMNGMDRIHPGNAYKAEWVNYINTAPEFGWVPDNVILVECNIGTPRDKDGKLHWRSSYANHDGGEEEHAVPVPPGGLGCFDETPTIIMRSAATVTAIDHHQPGDPGYGKEPRQFLPASSIGQLITLLIKLGHHLPDWAGINVMRNEYPLVGIGISHFTKEGWLIAKGPAGNEELDEVYFKPSELILVAAAADHCLAHAYAARCPGINIEELAKFRVNSRAELRKQSPALVRRDIEMAMAALKAAPRLPLGPDPSFVEPVHEETSETPVHADYGMFMVSDLRGLNFPELPEAACRLGMGYITTVTDKDGRVKDILGGLIPPQLIRVWMSEMKNAGREVYGDPERGFAGAYQNP